MRRRQTSSLIDKGYIPLDIYWTVRMGILDLLNGKKGIHEVLKKQLELPEELKHLQDVVTNWDNKEIGVESEFIYKCLKMAYFEGKTKKVISPRGILASIDLKEENVRDLSLAKLVELDPKHGRWATGYILANMIPTGDIVTYPTIQAYEAVRHWKSHVLKIKRGNWRSYYDDPILRQAENFYSLTGTGKIDFHVRYAEDYPFARAFDLIKPDDLPKRFSLYLDETESALAQYAPGATISTDNGRIVQAFAMRSSFFGDQVKFSNPASAQESWPQFWKFLKEYS